MNVILPLITFSFTTQSIECYDIDELIQRTTGDYTTVDAITVKDEKILLTGYLPLNDELDYHNVNFENVEPIEEDYWIISRANKSTWLRQVVENGQRVEINHENHDENITSELSKIVADESTSKVTIQQLVFLKRLIPLIDGLDEFDTNQTKLNKMVNKKISEVSHAN